MKKSLLLSLYLSLVPAAMTAYAQGTAFAYQGRLENNGSPANGNYDLTFTLYTTNVDGVAVAGPVTDSATAVTNGLFSVTIDFGSGVFAGNNYWLDISVSPAGSNTFTDLTPRQPILPTPYAMMATTASNLLGTLPASQVTGTIPMTQLSSAILTNTGTGVTLSGTFSGNGGGLTNLNASKLNGPIPSASLTSVPAANLTGTVSPAQLPSAVVTNTETAVTLSGSFSGNGSGLTALNPANLSAGTAAINISGNAATATSAATAVSATTAGTATSATTATTAATATLASNLAPGATITSAFITNSIFAGNGGGLTDLNASQLNGPIPSASLTSVPAANLTGMISPAQLPSAVVTNTETAVTLSGSFSGNGGGLTNLPAPSISTNGSSAGQVLTSSGGVTTWANANPWLGGIPTLVTNSSLSTNAVLVGRDRAFFLGFITSTAGQPSSTNYFTIKLSQAISTNAVMATFSPGTRGSWTNSVAAFKNGQGFELLTTSNSVTVQSVGGSTSSCSYGMFVHVDQF